MIYNKSTYYKRSFKYLEGVILMLINIIKINLLAAVFILAALLISRLLKNMQIAAYYGQFCGAKRPQCGAERPGFLLI